MCPQGQEITETAPMLIKECWQDEHKTQGNLSGILYELLLYVKQHMSDNQWLIYSSNICVEFQVLFSHLL